jgi:thiol-disulfide isomerase/thioredoxin
MATRKAKAKAKAKAKVLKVDAVHKIKDAEKLLKNGSISVVLIYAEWCGACHRFMKNIWNPSCSNSAKHQRIAVREDMVRNTSLANANFKYLPSLILVDEKGQMQNFKTPEGDTNAMPTPKNKEELNRIVNVPVLPLSSLSPSASSEAKANTLGVVNNTRKANGVNTLGVPNNRVNTLVPNNRVNNTRKANRVNTLGAVNTLTTNVLTRNAPRVQKNNSIPNGKIYTPTPQIAPAAASSATATAEKQKGGANALPAAILGSLAMLLRRKTRRLRRKAQ